MFPCVTLERKDPEFQVNFCYKKFPLVEKEQRKGRSPFIQITQVVHSGLQALSLSGRWEHLSWSIRAQGACQGVQ